MKYYVIDGNNLIGKIPELKQLQKKDPQSSREQIAFRLDRFFSQRKYKVSLHFDGFPKEPIKTSKIRIVYSHNKTADDKIREQIERAKNPKLLTIITSDRPLREFAKVCSCETLTSEDFASKLQKQDASQSEKDIIDSLDNDEFKRIFGVD